LNEYIPMRLKQKNFLPSYLRYSIEYYVLLAFTEKFNHFIVHLSLYFFSVSIEINVIIQSNKFSPLLQ